MIHLDITYRQAEEYAEYERRIAELEQQLQRKDQEIFRMSQYAGLSLRLTDQLREARRMMQRAGLDTSWIQIK